MALTILSLCDGLAAARASLALAGIPVAQYFAVEISQQARAIADHNFPQIQRPAHDIYALNAASLPAIDLVISGFPCQPFSKANTARRGLSEPRGAVIHRVMAIIKATRPRHFILENVVPSPKDKPAINQIIGTDFAIGESANYGAQSRRRAFWTNAPIQTIPHKNPKTIRDIMLPPDHPEITSAKTSAFHPYPKPHGRVVGDCRKNPNTKFPHRANRVYTPNAKSPTLLASAGSGMANFAIALTPTTYRRLTLTELLRLQNLPDNYLPTKTKKTPARQAIGNAWDCAIMADIMAQLFPHYANKTPLKYSLF